MGEIANAMLDGTLCEGCGEFIGEGDGIPRYCSPQCAADGCATEPMPPPAPKQHGCPICGKRFREAQAVADHRRVKHANKENPDAR